MGNNKDSIKKSQRKHITRTIWHGFHSSHAYSFFLKINWATTRKRTWTTCKRIRVNWGCNEIAFCERNKMKHHKDSLLRRLLLFVLCTFENENSHDKTNGRKRTGIKWKQRKKEKKKYAKNTLQFSFVTPVKLIPSLMISFYAHRKI